MSTLDEVVERVRHHTGCGWRELEEIRDDIGPLLLAIWLRGAAVGATIIVFAVALAEWRWSAP